MTEELLRVKLATLQRAYEAMDTAVIPSAKRAFAGLEFINWLVERSPEPGPMMTRLKTCVNEELNVAWGKPGEPGDPVKILDTVNAMVGCCRDLAKWEFDIFLAEPPKQFKRLSTVVRGFAAGTIAEVSRLPEELARAVEGARKGGGKFELNLALAGPPQAARLKAEMDKVAEKVAKNPKLLGP